MSYCIFGNAFRSDDASLEGPIDHAMQAFIKAGAEEGMSVRLGKEQVPQNLLGILKRDLSGTDSSYVTFLIAGPNDMDHSEDILFLQGALPVSREYREFLQNRLRALQRVFQVFFESGSFSRISVIFSSAYNPNYPETACSISEMAQIAYEKLRVEDWDATFKLNVKPR